MKKFILLALLGILLVPSLTQALNVPDYKNWVNDFANVIDDQTEATLNQRISEFEQKTSNEIAVVTIPSLVDESLEGFSIKLAEKWKVGKEDKDNGIILLFAIKEKKVRLEVGYGLEGVINDAKAGRILDDYVVAFRNEGNYTKAAESGVEGIIKNIGEEPWTKEQSNQISIYVILLIIGLVVLVIIGASFSSGGFGFFSSGGSGSSGDSDSGSFGGGSFGGAGASR